MILNIIMMRGEPRAEGEEMMSKVTSPALSASLPTILSSQSAPQGRTLALCVCVCGQGGLGVLVLATGSPIS